MPTPLDHNLAAWNEKARTHLKGHPVYPIADFIAGKAGISSNTPDDLGPVQDKKLLHLQCHFGMDTLMWARNGAIVTGVDFSDVAIHAARDLAAKTKLQGTFIQSDIADLPTHPDAPPPNSFDIILTYYGTITWLPDLTAWARTIAHFLKPGGFFYIADTHPLAQTFDIPQGEFQPRQVAPYFQSQPQRYESAATYAGPNASHPPMTTYEWLHTTETVIHSLLAAGLRLDYLHEFPYTFYNMFYSTAPNFLEQRGIFWRPRDNSANLPLMFSLKATRP